MNNTKRSNLHRLCAYLLALCLSLSLLPAFELPIGAAYSDAAMDKLLNWGVVNGYPDGGLYPERQLSRAEFVAMVNRAYGYDTMGETPFIDVPQSAWYHDDINIAYNANYFSGVSPRMAAPARILTREEAMVLLARNMRLDPVDGEVTEFADGHDFGDWSRGYARAAQQAGIVSGYTDGSFKPKSQITRGEMAVMLQRALGTLINKPGVHTLSDVYGNVTISSPNTTLRDSTIAGNLYITGGLDLGDINLENVRVLGDIIVAGGGESQSGESIRLVNVEADSLKVDSILEQYVSLSAEGNTAIGEAVLKSNAYIQDRTRPGEGLLTITLDSPDADAEFTLSGNLENVVNKTPNSSLKIAMGTVDNLTIDEYAKNSTLNLDINSTAMQLNLDTATNVIGVGDIDKLYVNAPGASVEMLPDTITIRPGLTADIAGETMDAQQAKESSDDPRLLAGYPKVRNIAPTSAQSVYSANKSGSVYWAVSTTSDGSIDEDELVTPTEGNTRILLNGTTDIESANTEYMAALEQLTSDSNYYLSTVMVDARGRHSPVKVASFTTPDDTVPAFTQGYPTITQNDFYHAKKSTGEFELDDNGDKVPVFRAQVSGMANKTCQIYFALYPAGSAQPTGQQFRTGSLGKVVQSGVEDISKNEVWRHTFKGLDEQTSYDLYLWLTDADGAHSSQVYKLTFKTVDGTPPKFQYETPVVSGNPPATSIPTRVNVNEAATVYWVAIKHGDDYIKAIEMPDDATTLEQILAVMKEQASKTEEKSKILDVFKRKIESGSGSVRNGSTRVTGDRDTDINITGLQAETAYDIYYVAKDTAGNYSDVKVLEAVRTLDVTPPTVDQKFSRTNEKEEPYADTDIDLVFSEDIQLYPAEIDKETGNPKTLTSVASDPVALGKFLDRIISFYNDSGNDPNKPIPTRTYDGDEATSQPTADAWTIDYRKAKVSQNPDTGEVTVTLVSSTDASGNPDGAINLKSGATYHFAFKDIQDLATTPNRMKNMPFSLPSFRTIAAQVQLRKDVSDATIEKYKDLNGTTHENEYAYTDSEGNTQISTAPLEIDMAFSLRPISVSVNTDVRWDMLLWTDTTVEFEVYRRSRDVDSTHVSDWQKLTTSARSAININASSDENQWAAKGLTYLRQKSEQPYVRAEATGTGAYDPLDPNLVYEYAIHFTKVGNVNEFVKTDGAWSTKDGRDTWNTDIQFRVNVITADTPMAFDLLKGGAIYQSTYTTMKERGALEINTTDSGSPYFTLYKSFSVRSAPAFTQGYPTFVAEDIGAEISVMTDRAGTVYWVVAPMTRKNAADQYYPVIPPQRDNTTFSAHNTSIGEKERYAAYYSEGGSGDQLVPDRGVTSPSKPLTLDRPYPDEVFNPSISDDRVRTGNIHVTGTSVQTISVPDLDPATSYYAYFVLQSEGKAIYSEKVELYQFWTEAVNRPKLVIEGQGSGIVDVRSTNLDAKADYAIFLMTGLPNELSEKFFSADVLGDDFNDESKRAAIKAKLDAINPKIASSYTVYQALESLRLGGTVYDEFACTDHKDRLRKLIINQTYSPGFIDRANATLTKDVSDRVNCPEKWNKIQAGQKYLFIASAISVRANPNTTTGDTYGFAAFQPIEIRDTTPPRISAVDGLAYVNFKSTEQAMGNFDGTTNAKVKPYCMSGEFDLVFDKDLYLYVDDNTRYPFADAATHTANPTTTAGFSDFRSTSNTGFSVTAVKKSGSSNVRTVSLKFENLDYTKDATFTANVNLVSYYSPREAGAQLVLTLHYDAASKHVTLTAKPYNTTEFSETYWTDNVTVTLPTETEAPDPTGLRLSTYSIGMATGEERGITAIIQPDGAEGTIRWEVDDASVVEIDPATGESVTVRALKGGTAKIKAYVKPRGAGAEIASAECTVTVTAVSVTITEAPKVELAVGATTQLHADVYPPTTVVSTVVWNSFRKDIASIDLNGNVTGVSKGTTTVSVTVTTADGSSYSATCTVVVN